MLNTLAQISTALGGFSIMIAMFALLKERRTENLANLFYLHQYLAQEEFSAARRRVRTSMYSKPYDEWSTDDLIAANRVCTCYDQAGLLLGVGAVNKKTVQQFLSTSWGESILRSIRAARAVSGRESNADQNGSGVLSPLRNALH
ncbi:MAG: hypothetical protein QM774_01465 [Gordonia sp. (in: high G+C Gram-positive bacteria)]|uniref:hypothetical protein n=1 Tax=Gordonia sp. (in: high G+C Gram-positive bacteria) TaxID=84139 RepID=UPI0039E725A9